MTGKTYRLGSSEMIHAPSLIEWAINGAHFGNDRPHIVRMITQGWGVPADAAEALVTKKVPYKIEGETVVFSVEETA